MVTKLEYQNYLQLMEHVYKKIEHQRRVNKKQWLCKDQARSVIVYDQKAWENVSYALFLNSNWPNVE